MGYQCEQVPGFQTLPPAAENREGPTEGEPEPEQRVVTPKGQGSEKGENSQVAEPPE